MDSSIQLIGAKEASKYLGININTVYKLWNNNTLEWWSINGTKKTTRKAIEDFLEKYKCISMSTG